MLIKIHPETPSLRQIRKVVDVLREGGVVIYPTDSVYGIGCDINNTRAYERIARLKNISPTKANFSFICADLSEISEYTRPLDNHIFKLMKKNLPGPFTFILPASNKVPKMFKNKRKTAGIRVPENNIIHEIVRELGNPIITTSVPTKDEIIEYRTDPELIYENYSKLVDVVISGGYGSLRPSTVVNCSSDEVEIMRQGHGILEE